MDCEKPCDIGDYSGVPDTRYAFTMGREDHNMENESSAQESCVTGDALK
jgi:hypothetical protein